MARRDLGSECLLGGLCRWQGMGGRLLLLLLLLLRGLLLRLMKVMEVVVVMVL